MSKHFTKILAIVMVLATLVTMFAVPASAAGYYMACTIYYKDEAGNQVATTKTETLKVCKGARIRTLSLSNVLQQNKTDAPETFFLNEGEIDRLYMYNVDVGEDLLLDNKGTIKKISEM